MRKYVSCLMFFLVLGNLAAQSEFSLMQYNTDSSGYSTGILNELQYNSSAITNEFTKTFINGAYLTSEMKNSSYHRMNEFSRLGIDLNYGVHFSGTLNKIGKRNPYHLNYFLGVYNREHADLSFQKNLFSLIFYGNKQYAGQTVETTGFNFNLLRYQQIQLGLFYNNGLGKTLALGVSLLNGEENISYSVPYFDFYTSQTGNELKLSWELDARQTSALNTGFAVNNGWGFSTDLMYRFSYNSNSFSNNYFQFEVNDLGFINWNNQSLHLRSNDSVFFNGYEIKNVMEIHDSLIGNISTDTLLTSYSTSGYENYTTLLPAKFSLTLRQEQSSRLLMQIGMNYRINANYLPYLYFEEHFIISKTLQIRARLSYGGYSKLTGGIGLSANFKRFKLITGTNNLDGLIFTKQRSGLSAFIAVSKQF